MLNLFQGPRKSILHYFIVILGFALVPSIFSLKSFGEPCESDCDERLGLFCSRENVCECMDTNATVFDSKRSRCVSRAGFPCSRFGNETFCVENAVCDNVNLPCSCKKNYFQTRNGTCSLMAKYGDNCNSIKKKCDTASGIECVERKCQCKYPQDQNYNSQLKKCISYAGGNCSFSFPCVPNADCSLDIFELRQGLNLHGKLYRYNATIGKKCACRNGFTETRDRKCLATLNHFCNSTTLCNHEENLDCTDNICLCKHPLHQTYNKDLKKCVHLVGALCPNGDSDCTPHSECIEGKCQCKPGFSSTPRGNCLKDHKERCSSKECNIFNGLSCRSGVCKCIDEFLVYDKAKQACVGKESGSFCGLIYLPNFNASMPGKSIFIGCKDHLNCEKMHEGEDAKSYCN